MMKIQKYINVDLSGCGCNLKCSYCYLRQRDYCFDVDHELKYSIDTIKKACSIERIGGVALFAIVGDGETLMPDYIIDLIFAIIDEGHYVTVLTNGTISKKIQDIVNRLEVENKKDKFCFQFSLHYFELVKANLLDKFFDNIHYTQEHGISFVVKTVLGEEFNAENAKEFIELTKEKIGGVPQVSIARNDSSMEKNICTNLTDEEYFAMGDLFESELFELDKSELQVRREEFCYAGLWVFFVNFTTGICTECLGNRDNSFNFFENLDKPLTLYPVGRRCKMKYCQCCNFQAWGLIPERTVPTNKDIYDREGTKWLTDSFIEVFSTKLFETNKVFSEKEKEENDLQVEKIIKAKIKQEKIERLNRIKCELKNASFTGKIKWVAEKIKNRL